MRLTEIPALLLEETVRTWRRRLVAGVVILISGIAAMLEGISAARLALQTAVGPVGGRLVLGGIFLVVVAIAAIVLVLRERRAAAQRAAKPFGGDKRVSAIAEAINLGYTLAQDFRRGRSPNGAAAAEAAADGRSDGEAPDPASVRREP
jgi:hypothetical protein